MRHESSVHNRPFPGERRLVIPTCFLYSLAPSDDRNWARKDMVLEEAMGIYMRRDSAGAPRQTSRLPEPPKTTRPINVDTPEMEIREYTHTYTYTHNQQ